MAMTDVVVPQLSESVSEATLLTWKKQPGEAIQADEILIEVETDKVVLEVPAPASGVLAEIVKGDGSLVTSGELLARIDTEGKAGTAQPAAAAPAVEKLGRDIWNTTYYPKAVDHVPTEKTWYIIDAKGQRLGRMATLIARYLRGANKPTYTPSQDMGSYVVVINAEQVAVTGRKREQKMYVRHTTGRPGGHVVESFQALQGRIPCRIVEEAVWGMIPKEKLGRHLFTHLKCYKGGEHPHAAQVPVDITHLIAETCMP